MIHPSGARHWTHRKPELIKRGVESHAAKLKPEDQRSAMSEAMESVIAARKIRDMERELQQYLVWSGQGDVWDEIIAEHTSIVQKRKAAELAAKREAERLEKQKRERALIATVIGTGGIILYHLVNYIIEAWPNGQ